MQDWQIFTLVIFLTTLLLIFARSAYLRGIEIQERAATERSRANALERTNQRKVEGLFELQLQKLVSATVGQEGDEISQLLPLLSLLGKKKEGDQDHTVTQGLTWDVLKEQLQNPEVKKLVLENQKEALEILKEK